jgi:hypothetical protein
LEAVVPTTRRRALLGGLAAAALLAAGAAGAAAQTAPSPTVTLTYKFVMPGPSTTFSELKLKSVPAGSFVVVRCLTPSGARCHGSLHKVFTRRQAGGTVRLSRFENKAIKGGNRLEAEIDNSSYATMFKTLRVRRNAIPTLKTQCRQPSTTNPARGPC